MPRMKWDRVGKESREKRQGVEWTRPEGAERPSPYTTDTLSGSRSTWKDEQELRTLREVLQRTNAPRHSDNLRVLSKYYGGSIDNVMARVRAPKIVMKKNAAGVSRRLPSIFDFPDHRDLTDAELAKLVAQRLSTWDDL